MTTPDLQTLITAGLDGARLVFGAGGQATPATTGADRGRRCFTGGPDPAIAALLTNDQPSVDLVLGAVVAGGQLVSLPLPPRASDPQAYGTFLRAACRAHGITRVVVRDDLAPLLGTLGITTVPHSELATRPLAETAGGVELVQFTSGSTGPPKGIVLDGSALGANVHAIVTAVAPRPGDVTVSWLPLSHDMGLIGMLLTSIAACTPDRVGRGSIVILPPEDFLRAPAAWIEALDTWRGTFTASPDFGFRLAATKRPRHRVDLSPLRCAIAGGEIVRGDTLRSFTETFADDDLRSTALSPAYGLAELGLAATITPPGQPWRSTTVDPVALGAGIRAAPAAGAATVEIVARGRNIHAPAVEAAVSSVAGVRPGRVTAIDSPSGEWIVVAESQTDDTSPNTQRDIRRAAVETCAVAPDHVVLVRPGRLPMTSSGKVQRHEVRRRWLTGSLLDDSP